MSTELGQAKYYANRGVKRNKTRLPNIRYKVEISQLNPEILSNPEKLKEYEKYKFKDLGYLTISSTKSLIDKYGEFFWSWHGFIGIDDLKILIGVKQYQKFCQGKREFIIQRRVNGKNI
jgi:hypothetical protein